jgi:ADP-ribose pyrophosphatase
LSQERTLHSESIYQGRLVSLRVDTVELPSGRETRREIVEHDDVVAIVPLDDGGNVLLVRQYRKAVGKALLEIPAGLIERGESPLECARRELAEETGHSAETWEDIGGFYTSPGFCTEYIYLFLATDLASSRLEPDYDEIIDVVPCPLADIPDVITSGEVCDAKSVAGLLTVYHKRQV